MFNDIIGPMARLSSEALKDSLWFPTELGQRLATLRRRRKLTQKQLAELMGRKGRGNFSMVSAIERGRMKTPSLRLVGDYLRACGASFRDVIDLLDRYTSKPTALEAAGRDVVVCMAAALPQKVAWQVQDYDAAVARERRLAGRLPEPTEPRQQRVRKYAVASLWRKRVRRLVVGAIEQHKLRPSYTGEFHLQTFASKVWSACWRTRGEPGQKRERELKLVRDWFLGTNVVEPRSVELIEQAVVQYFLGFECSQNLDRLPAEGEVIDEAQRSSDSGPEERRRRLRAYNIARSKMIDDVCDSTRPLLAELGVPERQMPLYLSAVRQACAMVENCGLASQEFRRQLDEYANQPERVRVGQDPDKVRRIVEFAAERYGLLRRALPQNPHGDGCPSLAEPRPENS